MGLFGPTKKGGGLDMRFKSNKGGYLGKTFGFFTEAFHEDKEAEERRIQEEKENKRIFLSYLNKLWIFITNPRNYFSSFKAGIKLLIFSPTVRRETIKLLPYIAIVLLLFFYILDFIIFYFTDYHILFDI